MIFCTFYVVQLTRSSSDYPRFLLLQFINSFVSGNGGEEFLQRAQNFTVGELLPAKINFIMNAYNNSEGIAKVNCKESC